VEIQWDRDADSVYVYFSHGRVVDSRIIDDYRFVHFDEQGDIRGLEFLYASEGVLVSDMPIPVQAVADALISNGIPVIDAGHIVEAKGLTLATPAAYNSVLYRSGEIVQMVSPLRDEQLTVGEEVAPPVVTADGVSIESNSTHGSELLDARIA
jgi:uncharacterized protein YuzE